MTQPNTLHATGTPPGPPPSMSAEKYHFCVKWQHDVASTSPDTPAPTAPALSTSSLPVASSTCPTTPVPHISLDSPILTRSGETGKHRPFPADHFLTLPNFLQTAEDAEDILALARATHNAILAEKLATERQVEETGLALKMLRRHLARAGKLEAADREVGPNTDLTPR